MKLYAFHPNCHGPLSFFVMANDEQQARKLVENHIKETDISGYDYDGWIENSYGNKYEMEVFEPGQVAVNDNA